MKEDRNKKYRDQINCSQMAYNGLVLASQTALYFFCLVRFSPCLVLNGFQPFVIMSKQKQGDSAVEKDFSIQAIRIYYIVITDKVNSIFTLLILINASPVMARSFVDKKLIEGPKRGLLDLRDWSFNRDGEWESGLPDIIPFF